MAAGAARTSVNPEYLQTRHHPLKLNHDFFLRYSGFSRIIRHLIPLISLTNVSNLLILPHLLQLAAIFREDRIGESWRRLLM